MVDGYVRLYQTVKGCLPTPRLKQWMPMWYRLEVHRHHMKAYKCQRQGAPGSHTLKEWKDKLREFNYCCVYCFEPLEDKPTVDHIQPLIKGGTNNIDNIVPACSSCNSSKGAKILLAFIGSFIKTKKSLIRVAR